ncbi:PecA family PE domain-processing aspartic protease, partial [Mycobacterium alsense]|uniref:PecA family PE domain-processing aspartic protease n=1 Tax=Mycobacterium alsense TaxID=324058 RepID=UPI0013F4F60F
VAGGIGGAGGAAPLLGVPGATGATGGAPTIPVTVDGQINRPYVNVSIGGGPNSQVTLDTGSKGLVVPPQDVDFATLGPSTGTGTVVYGQGADTLTETYNTYSVTVDFGNGIVTLPTSIAVITSVTDVHNGVSTILPASDGVAVLGVGFGGVGTVGVGPLSTNPIQALPGTLAEGILINEPSGTAQFGANPLTPYATASGAPVTNLLVTVNGGAPVTMTNAFVDSGGLWGDVPSSLGTGSTADGYVPQGTVLDVYTAGGQGIYEETVGASPSAPDIIVGGNFNTGNLVFKIIPVYLSYSPSGVGTLFFDNA